MEKAEVENRVEDKKRSLIETISECEAKLSEIRTQMTALKTKLYGKFGKVRGKVRNEWYDCKISDRFHYGDLWLFFNSFNILLFVSFVSLGAHISVNKSGGELNFEHAFPPKGIS